jgi:uncharacterized repeat protein (TIGR03806 family)
MPRQLSHWRWDCSAMATALGAERCLGSTEMPMKPRRQFTRSTLAGLACFAAVSGAAVIACKSSHDDGGGGDNSGPSIVGAAGDAAPGPGQDKSAGPPTRTIIKREFPVATPDLGGYTLTDVYPDIVFDIPAAIAWPKGAGALPFVLERTGQLKRIENGNTARTVLDFGGSVHVAGEGGAVGLVFHPQFGDGTGPKPYVYVWYNALPLMQRLQRYTWSPALNAFDPASVVTMVETEEFENIHNGAKMLFGPNDGFLYFGNGDDNQVANHQTITNGLFAGIFRVDVDMDPTKSHPPPAHTTTLSPFTRTGYWIPNDNPFVGAVPNGLEEFYALGFRNPFSFSFDRQNGNFWMGDVGDVFREEVNHVVKGGNYQWPVNEGELVSMNALVKTLTVGISTPPTFYYSHAEMADLTAIFGGIVYRGPSLPELNGKYVYTDWLSNRIWALDLDKSPVTRTTLIDNQYTMQPMAIGEDNDGEFYVLQYDPVNGGGHVKKIIRDAIIDSMPQSLLETTLFDDVPTLKPAANLVPYAITSPLWSDGAGKSRWIRLPEGQKVTYADDGTLKFPVGTVFVKQFDLPDAVTVTGRSRHLETRVMVVGTDTTWGSTYRWNADGTDANLVFEGADETILDTTTNTTRNWHYPSFGQCWSCHRDGNYRILGFKAIQLGPDERTFLAANGVFDPADVAKMPAPLPTPSDTTKTIEERATSYLAANCSPCHHEGGSFEGGGQTWLATYGSGSLAARGLDQPSKNWPMTVRLGIPGGTLVVPGDPQNSVLLGRIKTNDPDLRMPPLARNVVDTDGAAIIEQWIASMAH